MNGTRADLADGLAPSMHALYRRHPGIRVLLATTNPDEPPEQNEPS